MYHNIRDVTKYQTSEQKLSEVAKYLGTQSMPGRSLRNIAMFWALAWPCLIFGGMKVIACNSHPVHIQGSSSQQEKPGGPLLKRQITARFVSFVYLVGVQNGSSANFLLYRLRQRFRNIVSRETHQISPLFCCLLEATSWESPSSGSLEMVHWWKSAADTQSFDPSLRAMLHLQFGNHTWRLDANPVECPLFSGSYRKVPFPKNKCGHAVYVQLSHSLREIASSVSTNQVSKMFSKTHVTKHAVGSTWTCMTSMLRRSKKLQSLRQKLDPKESSPLGPDSSQHLLKQRSHRAIALRVDSWADMFLSCQKPKKHTFKFKGVVIFTPGHQYFP